MKARIREQAFTCGDYKYIRVFPVFEQPKGCRRPRFKPTSDVQERLNEYNSRQHLARLIAANFTASDVWIHPTFRPEDLPETVEDFKRVFHNFIRRLGRAYKRRGAELKYVAVLEVSETGRYHVHMIVNSLLTADAFRDIWGMGRVRVDALDFDETGVIGLANYMTKYRLLTKRYLRSRNLIDPPPETRDGRISQRKLRELAASADVAAEFEALYPGYRFAVCRPFYNEINTYRYLSVVMYKPSKNRRNE